MSFILDALKKLEREKAARSNAGVNISEEILRGSHRGRRTGTRSLTAMGALAALALLVIGAVVAGVMFWQRDRAPQETREYPAGGESRYGASAVPERPRLPDTPNAPAGSEPAPAAPAPLPAPRPMESTQERKTVRNPVHASVGADSAEGTSEPNQLGAPPAGAEVKVSGIAWQEKRSARRAVVNGLLVPEGTPVAGVTVKEIFQNRVRFQANGRMFDVYISGPLLGDTSRAEPSGQSARNDRPPQADLSMATTPRRSPRGDGQTPNLSGVR